jgi:hypothetical protein
MIVEKQQYYLDTNFYRRYKNDIQFYNRVNSVEGLSLEGKHIIFTWTQFLENVDGGSILTAIVNDQLWQDKKLLFKDSNADYMIESLKDYFYTLYDMVLVLPQVSREQLLTKIKVNIEKAHSQASYLLDCTMRKKQNIIEDSDNYKESLAMYLAWKYITSNPFIQSFKQWENRSFIYNSLIALWYKLWVIGIKLEPYQLFEKRYYSYVNHSAKASFDTLKLKPLRPLGDLCDGELISHVALGYKGKRVIGITSDPSQHCIKNRMAIMKQTLVDLQRDVQDWKMTLIYGKIYMIDKEVSQVCIIPMDIPFSCSL